MKKHFLFVLGLSLTTCLWSDFLEETFEIVSPTYEEFEDEQLPDVSQGPMFRDYNDDSSDDSYSSENDQQEPPEAYIQTLEQYPSENTYSENTNSCCCNCCPPKDPCAKCAQLWPGCGPDWIITPGAGPCVSCGCDIFITAEFIYWAPRQDHLGFVAAVPTVTTNTFSTNVGKFFHPNWKMEPGFRVGIGWLSCIDGWDFYFNYTWLRPRAKKRVQQETNFALEDAYFTFGNLITGTDIVRPLVISEEVGKWRLNFNVLDFEWGRNFYISQCLYLRPYFGLKGTWQDQHFKAAAIGIQTIDAVDVPVTSLGKHRIDWWGIGPRAGLDSAWHFTNCFSVLGEVAATALWGKFESKSFITETNLSFEETTINPQGCLKTEWHTVKPVLEFLLGLRYETWWCCDRFYTALDIGWEVQWWQGQNQFVNYLTETRWGDLSFQGLTVRTRFQF